MTVDGQLVLPNLVPIPLPVLHLAAPLPGPRRRIMTIMTRTSTTATNPIPLGLDPLAWPGAHRLSEMANGNEELFGARGEEYPLDIPSYVDPRMPTGSEPGYLASCLDSFYYPGMPPVLPDLSDEWSHPMQNHLHGGWEQQEISPPYTRNYTVGAQETHSEYGKEGSNCSTTDTDQVKVDVPTKGSAKHHLGLCKPCAFVFKDGCNTGWECEFCHLCEPGEKKRRKKERKQIRRQKVN
ncbi:unnamed protein product [Symbiodinium natans]|uniref:C3H1-type domain-containing protein n=1 Tax=Symbiodinium natans TaxID=878477 RepID=A0A812KBC4_9DINO|nr:unnamed protein product [Symbiodinium natans]